MFKELREPRRWLRATVWSTALTVGVIAVTYWRDPCWLYLDAPETSLIRIAVLWSWLLAFGMLGTTGRLVFGFTSLVVYLQLYGALRARVPEIQSRTVAALRRERDRLEEHRKNDPRQGYPMTISLSDSEPPVYKYYRFTYVPKPSVSGGLVDSYEIRVVGIRRECGFARNFTLTSDGNIYHTTQPRPATPQDPPI